jgi:predicted ATPase/DNA-binding winged helix-turn-helix (wHTH) protein
MIDAPADGRDVVSFGPFSLDAGRRLLLNEGAPVEIGGRALDTLIALVSRPNQLVSKRELMGMVWPGITVEDVSLRFHVAALRKALGDGKGGARYITTVAGRGYSFVAPLSKRRHPQSPSIAAPAPANVASFSYANLPGKLARMVGRDADVARLATHLTAYRFVSIVGSGGVGKTTVAVAVGHQLMEAFGGAVLFVDLGMVSDPRLLPTTAASMLGLSVHSDNATPNLIAYLRDKRMLLILDTCEHLVGAVADVASQIFAAASGIYILATSREALQVDDEHVYRLDPLGCPSDNEGLTAASIHRFPATQLFIERATASGARLQMSDGDVALIGDICRKLDGVALAIELAARRVESYGLQQTATLLDQRLALLWTGPRTATPRQKTLQATLDWSFGLLSELERLVLRRLAIFVGHFTLDAALDVVSDTKLDHSVVLGALDSLVAKSMVATRPIGAMVRYRLLDTTRAYALEIGIDSADFADLGLRHVAY